MQIPGRWACQMFFAQQTAAAITEHQKRQLASTAKAVILWTFCVWAVMALLALIRHNEWITALKLSNPASLWLTVAVGFGDAVAADFPGVAAGAAKIFCGGLDQRFQRSRAPVVCRRGPDGFHGLAAGIMFGVFDGDAGDADYRRRAESGFVEGTGRAV